MDNFKEIAGDLNPDSVTRLGAYAFVFLNAPFH
jgi:hypothetical protein